MNRMSMGNLLAGDVGGTTTRLGLFEKTPSRPRSLTVREFTTLDFPNLETMVAAFLRTEGRGGTPTESACFGVAGPVTGDVAELTNVPWRVDARIVARTLKVTRVNLLNDLEAMAYSVPVLHDSEVHVLQEGRKGASGNIGVIAAG